MRSILREMLRTLGCQRLIEASTGEEALAILRNRRIDIVVCDYNLGAGLDGQQLLEQARGEGVVGLATVFILVTAENSSEMILGALESLPDEYLAKPFTKDLLNARLQRALARREPLTQVAHALTKQGAPAALIALDKLLAQPSQRRLDLLRIQADLALQCGQLDRAAAACEAALSQRPLAWALVYSGRIAEAKQDFVTADAQYRQAIELTPHFMEAHDRLAALCESREREEEALTLWQQAAQRSPKSVHRQRRLAKLAQKLDRPDLAEPAWQRVQTLAKQMHCLTAADYAGEVETLVALGNLPLAKKRCAELVTHCRRDPLAPWWFVVARLHYVHATANEEERTQVLKLLETQLAQEKPPPELGQALAAALTQLGEHSRASLVV